jgi:hypothetical protein
MSEYILERVTPDHYKLLKDLYRDAFNSKMEAQDIQRRFDTTELGCEHIGFIAIHTETKETAAYYGVFPVTLILNDQQIVAAQSGDTMTHRRHRLKGLFILLAKLTFEECSKRKVQIIFGFPNDNSLPGFIKKLQWQQIDTILRFDLKLKVKTFPLAKICMHSNLLKKIYYKYFRLLFGKKIISSPASFTNTALTKYRKIFRNEKYIKYKQSQDKFFIAINNQIIWIKLADIFWIGDFSDYGSVNESVIREIKRFAFFLGYNTISFHINESVKLPYFLNSFKKYNSVPSCVLFLNNSINQSNILFTAADFDTW